MTISNEPILRGQVGQKLEEHLTPFIQGVIASHELPGLAIGIVAEGQVVYARGFGLKSITIGEPVSITTLFHMASVSKPFAATAIMQLVERDQLQLDAPIAACLPYFRLDDERYRDITIRQMLSHVSGMPDVEDYEWEQPQYDDGALERYARSLASEKLLFAPGEKFAYSNMAFECLGAVIARVSGLSFDDYVKQHILDPAGMPESTFLKPAHLPENWAAPHLSLLENCAWAGYPYNRMHAPSSTLHSNIPEMCNWAIANLNRGSFQGQQILDPSSYDLLWKPWAEVNQGLRVGLSWFIGEYQGELAISHGGSDIGFRTHFVMLPGSRAAAVVLCNRLPAPVQGIALAALDTLHDRQPAPILPPASLTVFKTLRRSGLEAAVDHWNTLKTQRPDQYNFDTEQFSSLYFAVMLERAQEAQEIASLCARVLAEAAVQALRDELASDPHQAAQDALEALGGHRNTA
ncbi:MAG: serine hydrolase domain-containing protein [Chloroflexota bacterium]